MLESEAESERECRVCRDVNASRSGEAVKGARNSGRCRSCECSKGRERLCGGFAEVWCSFLVCNSFSILRL